MVLGYVQYGLVLFILFYSLYTFTLHQHAATNNRTILYVIAIVTVEFTILILRKYGFQVYVILFGFYLSPCVDVW